MTFFNRVFKQLACALIAHLDCVVPQEHREWRDAMRAEFHHINNDSEALNWAFGCVVAGYTARIRTMISKDFRVAPWLLSVESLVCFLPLTLLWVFSMLNIANFLSEPRIAVAILFSTIAPASLISAFLMIVLHRPVSHKKFNSLALGFALLGALQIFSAATNPDGITSTHNFFWYRVQWDLVMLNSLLPGLCCLHLSHISQLNRDSVVSTS